MLCDSQTLIDWLHWKRFRRLASFLLNNWHVKIPIFLPENRPPFYWILALVSAGRSTARPKSYDYLTSRIRQEERFSIRLRPITTLVLFFAGLSTMWASNTFPASTISYTQVITDLLLSNLPDSKFWSPKVLWRLTTTIEAYRSRKINLESRPKFSLVKWIKAICVVKCQNLGFTFQFRFTVLFDSRPFLYVALFRKWFHTLWIFKRNQWKWV